MAWRPNEQFVEAFLDNTVPGKVTGWMKFAGMDEKVVFDLEENFHRDIRSAKVRLATGNTIAVEHASLFNELEVS
jgi:hypothetical protein